ncbi:VOC family protein [Pyxidicoccus sp. 3LG]
MGTKIFVNLPVQSLKRSTEFFGKLGYTFNAKFTDENATCMVIGEDIYAMLLVKDFFKGFIGKKEIADSTKTTESLIALSVNSRAEVDEYMKKVLEGGGTETKEATDHGFMYQRSFADLDGHQWEIFWMDPKAAQ